MPIMNTLGGAQSSAIPSNTDLNDYIQEGKYYIGYDGTQVTNKPDNANSFALIVIKNASYGDNGVTQFYIPYNDWRVYMRYRSYVPARWSTWKLVAKAIE